jgi:L-threonylcarbamoyladenylate synthase
LVLPRQARADGSPLIPDIVTAGLSTVAVRVPRHPVALALLSACRRPLAAPSANPFGRISPTTAEHVRGQLGDAVSIILDGGPCEVGVESTVLSLADPAAPPRLLRPGGVPLETLRDLLGEVLIGPAEAPHADGAPAGFAAPGMLPRHYAPATRVILAEELPRELPAGRLGYVGLLPPEGAERFATVETLSTSGNLREAAARLFAALRRLDAEPLDAIVAVMVPEEGLGRAINDRLRRASFTE